MALIVEDGSIVANADSYVSLVDARAKAALYGWALPADDTGAEAALRNGAKYADMSELRFGGSRVSAGQSLAWPRVGARKTTGFVIDSDVVPDEMICAQIAAAVEYGNGTDVRATNDGRSIASQEVTGSVKQSYFNNGKTGESVSITRADDCLVNLIVKSGGLYSFNVVRG